MSQNHARFYHMSVPSRFKTVLVISRIRARADEWLSHQMLEGEQKVLHAPCADHFHGLDHEDTYAVFIETCLDTLEYREMVGRDRVKFGGSVIVKIEGK